MSESIVERKNGQKSKYTDKGTIEEGICESKSEGITGFHF